MNYLELVESFGLSTLWKVQDEREEFICSCPLPSLIQGPFRRAGWDLSALQQSSHSCEANSLRILNCRGGDRPAASDVISSSALQGCEQLFLALLGSIQPGMGQQHFLSCACQGGRGPSLAQCTRFLPGCVFQGV